MNQEPLTANIFPMKFSCSLSQPTTDHVFLVPHLVAVDDFLDMNPTPLWPTFHMSGELAKIVINDDTFVHDG